MLPAPVGKVGSRLVFLEHGRADLPAQVAAVDQTVLRRLFKMMK